jgi:hypothetical protein
MSRISDRLIERTAKDLSINLDKPNIVDLLALQIILCVRTNDKSTPHLIKNWLCNADTLIFSAFFVRLQCMKYVQNERVADQFDDRFMPHIAKAFQLYFAKMPNVVNRMLGNRVNFYNELCTQNSILDQSTVLFEEFSNIIAVDVTSSSYQDYSESTPLVIPDVFEHFKISSEIRGYIHGLTATTNKNLQRIRNVFETLAENNTV